MWRWSTGSSLDSRTRTQRVELHVEKRVQTLLIRLGSMNGRAARQHTGPRKVCETGVGIGTHPMVVGMLRRRELLFGDPPWDEIMAGQRTVATSSDNSNVDAKGVSRCKPCHQNSSRLLPARTPTYPMEQRSQQGRSCRIDLVLKRHHRGCGVRVSTTNQ